MSEQNTSWDIWIAGAVAAFTVDLIIFPLDTIKTRIQSPGYKRLFTHQHNGTVNASALFRGMYQGVGLVVVTTIPSSGAFFTTYEGIKYHLGKANRNFGSNSKHGLVPDALVHATASGVAEAVSCAILTPAESIKQNAQMIDRTGGNKANATLQTLEKFRGNPLGVWRGYSALVARNLPFTALQFPMFERLKEYVKDYRDRRGIRTHTLLETGLITAASAGTAGSIAAVVTTPIDIVKTRQMLAAPEGDLKSKVKTDSTVVDKLKQGKPGEAAVDAVGKTLKPSRQTKSNWAVGREIYNESGIRGLFRGGALRGVWTMLGSGLYLGVYESGRVFLARRRGEYIDEDEVF